MKTPIRVIVLLAALSAVSACATTPTQVALSEYERCTRYGALWSNELGHCMHPGSR